MSAAVESLIVAMGFDNKQFEAAAKISMATLGQLKNSLNFGAQKDPLAEVQASASRFSMNPVSAAIEGVNTKFLAMSTIGITALSNITNKAIDAGTAMAKSLTIDPVQAGFSEYELKMGSIQTMLANTAKDYATHEEGLADVKSSLEELNTYADQTIYNFGDMTSNIGLFTNAGIGVRDATSMIKGFSNEAAASGTSAQGAAGAAYQLSQALSAGVVTLMDWKSLTNVGMGNANMRDGIIQIAEAMGTLDKAGVSATEVQKDFNGSLEKKWLSADVMENYLKIQAEGESEVGRELMKNIGLTDEQQAAFIKTQKTAYESATMVRTWTGLIGGLREAAGSSWATTSEILLGDFDAATTLFTGINNTIGPMIESMGKARNELLKGWADKGGRDMALDGLKNVFESLMAIIRPIKDAFRQIFPPTTVEGLLKMTEAFQKFSQKLKVSGETAENIKRTFAGVFAIFGIGWEAVKGLFKGIGQLFGAFQGGGGGLLSFTAKIGDFVVKIHEAIKNGEIFQKIFSVLATVIKAPIAVLGNFGQAISDVLGKIGGATAGLGSIGDVFDTVGSAISQFWNVLAKGDFVGGVFSEDSPIIDWLFRIRDAVGNFFSADGIKVLMGVGGAAGVGAGGFFGIKALIDKMFGGGDDGIIATIKGTFESIGGAFDGITDMFDTLTGSLQAMQNNLKASTLLKIAAAVGILAVALALLSTIDGMALVRSLAAVSVAFGLLLGAMAILSKIAGTGGFAMIPAIAVGMMAMSAAILILAAAAKVLATMEWGELFRGLSGVAILMAIVVAGAWGLGKVEGIMLRAAVAMIPFALGIRILVESVRALGEMDWDTLKQGMIGLAGTIVAIGIGLKLMPDNMVSIGVGLIAVGAAMLLISRSIESIGSMNVEVLRQGLIGLGIAIAGMGVALQLMPKNMPSLAAGLLVVSGALFIVSNVIQSLGEMGTGDMVQGLIGLAAALGIMVVSLNLMTGTLAGSAALAIAAGALALLLPSIIAMGMLSWGTILTGLGALAGVFLVLGVAGALLTPIVPTLLALGIAIGVMGLGALAVGAAVWLFAQALTALIGIAGVAKTALINLMDVIPLMIAAFVSGLTQLVVSLAENAGDILGALGKLIVKIIDLFISLIPKVMELFGALFQGITQFIIDNAPRVGEVFGVLLDTILNIITTNAPKIWDAGYALIIGFLQRIRDKVPEIVTIVGELIVNFINALATQTVNVVQAGVNFIVTVMEGIAQAIRDNSDRISNAALDIGAAIINGIIQGIGNGIERVAAKAREVASAALNAAKDFLGIHSPSREFAKLGRYSADGLVVGLNQGAKDVNAAGTSLARGLLGAAGDELSKIAAVSSTVMGILANGDFRGNGGLLDEDSPLVDTLFGIREGLLGIAGSASEAWTILTQGDFTGVGPWEEDDPIVDTLFNIHEGITSIGRAAEETWGILSRGDFTGIGPWQEDDPIVDTLFDIREGLFGVSDAAKAATDILTTGDFKGGPWEEDSPIVDGLFKIREGFEQFNTIGEDAVQGLINGLQGGVKDISKAAEDLANTALESARDALDIRSPSREFEKVGKYSVDGLAKGIEEGEPTIGEAGFNLAGALISGFGKGMGKGGSDLTDSILKVLKSGEGDLKIGGPNAPLTMQLKGLNQALKEADLQLAIFFGAVDAADPAALEKYVEEAGNNITYLAGLLDGLANSANQAFGMLEEGTTLDLVLGDEDLLTGLLNAVLSLVPGVEGAAIRLGVTVVNGLIGAIFGETLIGMVGNVITKLTQMVAGWFGYTFPVEDVEEDVKGAEDALENFLVTVEDGHGRFEKLTEEGVQVLKDALVNATEAANEIDGVNPTITPVLELTQFNKDRAAMLDGMNGISLDASSGQASSLYENQRALSEMQAETAAASSAGSTTIEFNQTNVSPKALSHVEIYKNTKGQLATAKEALGVS